MKKYSVTASLFATYTIDVYAKNKEEAREIALDGSMLLDGLWSRADNTEAKISVEEF